MEVLESGWGEVGLYLYVYLQILHGYPETTPRVTQDVLWLFFVFVAVKPGYPGDLGVTSTFKAAKTFHFRGCVGSPRGDPWGGFPGALSQGYPPGEFRGGSPGRIPLGPPQADAMRGLTVCGVWRMLIGFLWIAHGFLVDLFLCCELRCGALRFIATESKGLQRNPTESNRIQESPTGSNRIQQNPTESNRIHKSPTPIESKRIQQDPTESNRFQQNPTESTRVQQNPSDYKRNQ